MTAPKGKDVKIDIPPAAEPPTPLKGGIEEGRTGAEERIKELEAKLEALTARLEEALSTPAFPKQETIFQDDGSACFLSTSKNHIITMEKDSSMMNQRGQIKTVPGKYIVFKNYRYVTRDEDEIEFVRSLPSYGRDITEPGRQDYQAAVAEIRPGGLPQFDLKVKADIARDAAAEADKIAAGN